MIKSFNTTSAFRLEDISSKDMLTFTNYIMSQYRFNEVSDEMTITLNHVVRVDEGIESKMTTIQVYFIVHNHRTNINDQYIFRNCRAKDWSCYSISIESYK